MEINLKQQGETQHIQSFDESLRSIYSGHAFSTTCFDKFTDQNSPQKNTKTATRAFNWLKSAIKSQRCKYTVFPLNMAPLLFGTLEYFTSQKSFDGCCCIFIKTPYYDFLQTNGILNVNFHHINYALTQDLPYFLH